MIIVIDHGKTFQGTVDQFSETFYPISEQDVSAIEGNLVNLFMREVDVKVYHEQTR